MRQNVFRSIFLYLFRINQCETNTNNVRISHGLTMARKETGEEKELAKHTQGVKHK